MTQTKTQAVAALTTLATRLRIAAHDVRARFAWEQIGQPRCAELLLVARRTFHAAPDLPGEIATPQELRRVAAAYQAFTV